MITNTNLEEIAKGLKKTLLSSKWQTNIVEEHSIGNNAHRCFIDFRIDFDARHPAAEIPEITRKLFKETEQAIASTHVYRQLQSSHADELIAMKKEIESLKEHVKTLKPYRIYYDMAYRMQHGGVNPLAQVALEQQRIAAARGQEMRR